MYKTFKEENYMRKTLLKQFMVMSLVIIGSLTLVISCEDSTKEEETTEAELSRITPIDGSIDIALDASITVEFTEGMDINSCQSRFGVYMGDLGQIPTNMMGEMHGMMAGQFQWNDDQTRMTFHPDSMFMDSTMYSICLQEGMQMHHHGGGGMMGMNHMNGYGSTVNEGVISKFWTVQ
jgi:hypothetical protein